MGVIKGDIRSLNNEKGIRGSQGAQYHLMNEYSL